MGFGDMFKVWEKEVLFILIASLAGCVATVYAIGEFVIWFFKHFF